MKIRRHFLTEIGAFAAAVQFQMGAALAQVMPESPQNADLGNQGALYRFSFDVGLGGQVFCTAAVLPRRAFSAAIVQQKTSDAAPTAVRDIARASHATVAINGGRFNGAFAPDGLLIVDGKIIGRKRADWPGYITIDAGGNASVTNRPDLRRAVYAMQGDPLMIEPGGKMGMIREDNKRFRRTIIAQGGDSIVAMVTTPASLFSLAYAMLEQPQAFFLSHIDAALNLSGAATTSFYAHLADGADVFVPAYWPNRTVIIFSPR